MPLEGESVHGICILLSLCCVAFLKILSHSAVDFSPRKNWRNPRVFRGVSEDVRTLFHWLLNVKPPVGKAAFCLQESCYQGSFWYDGRSFA